MKRGHIPSYVGRLTVSYMKEFMKLGVNGMLRSLSKIAITRNFIRELDHISAFSYVVQLHFCGS